MIEDKFYINASRFDTDANLSCYDPFTIEGGNVLDLAANFTLLAIENVQDG